MKTIILLLSLSLLTCKGKQKIDLFDHFINPQEFTVLLGDTIHIYLIKTGGIEPAFERILAKEQLQNVDFYKRLYYTKNKGCTGCEIVEIDKFITKKRGFDTLIYYHRSLKDSTIINYEKYYLNIK